MKKEKLDEIFDTYLPIVLMEFALRGLDNTKCHNLNIMKEAILKESKLDLNFIGIYSDCNKTSKCLTLNHIKEINEDNK